MKTLKRLSATLFLVLCLASAAVSGDLPGPPIQPAPAARPVSGSSITVDGYHHRR